MCACYQIKQCSERDQLEPILVLELNAVWLNELSIKK